MRKTLHVCVFFAKLNALRFVESRTNFHSKIIFFWGNIIYKYGNLTAGTRAHTRPVLLLVGCACKRHPNLASLGSVKCYRQVNPSPVLYLMYLSNAGTYKITRSRSMLLPSIIPGLGPSDTTSTAGRPVICKIFLRLNLYVSTSSFRAAVIGCCRG